MTSRRRRLVPRVFFASLGVVRIGDLPRDEIYSTVTTDRVFDRPHLVVRHELPFDRPHPVVRHELPFDRPHLILVRRCNLVRNRPAVQLLNGLVSQSREDAAFHVAALPAGQVVLERARGHGSRVRGVHHLEPPVHRADVAVVQVILGGRRRSARWAAAVARSDGDDEQVGEFGDARIPEVAGNVPRVRPRDDAIVQYDKVLPTQSRRVYVEPRGLHRQGARLLRHEGVIRFEDGTAVDFDAPQRGQIPQSPFGVRDVHDVFEQGRGSGRHALVRGAGHHQIRRVALEVRREEALERPVDLRGVVPARGRRSVLEFRVSFGRERVLPRVEAAHEIDPTQGFIVMVPFDGIDGMLFDDHRFGFGSPPSTTRGHYLLRNAAHPKISLSILCCVPIRHSSVHASFVAAPLLPLHAWRACMVGKKNGWEKDES